MNIDYRYLKAFQLVAKKLNFSKAAKELKVAQSAISRQIKLLEEGLGEQLIVRSSKKVVLTEKGELLLDLINNFEKQANKIFFQEEDQVIHIGILHGLLENWFIQVIEAFNQQFSNPLEIHVGTPESMLEKLTKGIYDVIFTSEQTQSDLISSLRLFDEKHVLISKEEINLKDITKYPWIIYDENDHLMKLYKKRPNRIIQISSITAIIKMVQLGDGVAIVPDHALRSNEDLHQIEIKTPKKNSIYMTTLNYNTWPAPLKSLRDIVLES